MRNLLRAIGTSLRQHRGFYWNLAGVFLFGFCFISICYVGLPMDFTENHLWNIRGANALSYEELGRLAANPLTPAWFYPPDGLWEYLRPLQFLLMKAYFDGFQYSIVPFHFTAAFGLGILSIFFFAFVFYWTRSYALGWMAVLLYASFPSNYFLMSSAHAIDFHFIYTTLSASAILLWGMITSGKLKRRPFNWALAGWVLAVWLAIKIRSTEKLVPLICGMFLLVRIRTIVHALSRKRVYALLGALGFTMLLIVPLQPFEKWTGGGNERGELAKDFSASVNGKEARSFCPVNLLPRTFHVEGEAFPLTSVLRKGIPKSFTGNYGFLLGWLFWIGLGAVPFILLRKHAPDSENAGDLFERRDFSHYLALYVTWFCIAWLCFGSGVSLHDASLLNVGFLPSIFLFFMVVSYFDRKGIHSPRVHPWLRRFLVVAMGLTLIGNFGAWAQLVVRCGGFQGAIVAAERDIFNDFYKERPDELTLYQRHQNLLDRTLLVDGAGLPATWMIGTKGKVSREGIVYFLTNSEDSKRLSLLREQGAHAVLWHRYDILNAKPLFFRGAAWAHLLCKDAGYPLKSHEILVYRVTFPRNTT